MRRLKQLFEKTMLVVTFAEAGEFNMALDYLYDTDRKKKEVVLEKQRRLNRNRVRPTPRLYL